MRKYKLEEINLKIENVDFWGKYERNKGGIRIYWSSDIGFGQLDIVKRKGNDGDDFEIENKEEVELTCHTEYMDKDDDREFTRYILNLLVDFVKTID